MEEWPCCFSSFSTLMMLNPRSPRHDLGRDLTLGSTPQGHLRDQYGHLVNVYTKLLLTKISFHLKVVELWG